MTQNSDAVFDVKAPDFDRAAVRESLAKRGFAILRNLFDPQLVAESADRIRSFAENPAIAGVPGYIKVDHPKRMFSPFAVGGPLVDLVLNEQVIDLVEAHMNSECVLAEANVKIDEGVDYVYFDLHADFSVGWRKSAATDFVLDDAGLDDPIGVGGALYLHDTQEGAFCYCEGSHLLKAPRGPDLADYPAAERDALLASKRRLEGQAGDFVLFDDRGFHGPDQPSRSQRTVILVDYYRVNTFGYTQVAPMPVWTSDLGRLSGKQMRVLGAGADHMVSPQDYMGTRFRRNRLYPVIRFLVEHAYTLDHWKNKAKAVFQRRIN